jgi:hypothetical protein
MTRREFIKYSVLLAASLALPKLSYAKNTGFVIGTSKIIITRGSIIGTQVDRVFRDIQWSGSEFDITRKIQHFINDKKELLPYMEGRLSQLLIEYAEVMVNSLTPSIVKQIDNTYFANDGEGNYKFYVSPDKMGYPSVQRNCEDFICVDTHGFNMIAHEASKRRKYSTLIACMDLQSKADAAFYLASLGHNCYAPCDRYLYTLIGKPTKGVIIGSAPIHKHKLGAVIGDQPIIINLKETIIVQTSPDENENRYCDTPFRYFSELIDYLRIAPDYVVVSAGIGETKKIIDSAETEKATVIFVRIRNKEDADPISEWLKSNKHHKAVLFHSAPYDAGYEIFTKFKTQTTFGDLNIKRA